MMKIFMDKLSLSSITRLPTTFIRESDMCGITVFAVHNEIEDF
jgi:hypothetical protein